jgi:hypothetical protein
MSEQAIQSGMVVQQKYGAGAGRRYTVAEVDTVWVELFPADRALLSDFWSSYSLVG